MLLYQWPVNMVKLFYSSIAVLFGPITTGAWTVYSNVVTWVQHEILFTKPMQDLCTTTDFVPDFEDMYASLLFDK